MSVCNTMIETNAVSFQTDLALAYNSFGYYASLVNKTCKFYEYASYVQDTQYDEVQCHLNKNNVVTIQVADYGESYAIIKGIFKHKSNDKYFYSFIYVDWFENTYKNHNKLDCPIFILHHNGFIVKFFR